MSRGRRSPLVTVVAVVLCIAAGVGAGWLAFVATRREAPSAGPPPADAAVEQPPAASASAAVDAPVACPRAGVEATCLASLFPADTFAATAPDLTFICEETNPVRGGGSIRSAVVRGAGATLTASMKQWAVLGWYELPAFAAMQARCCPSPPPLELPPHPELCKAIGPALDGLARAVADPATPAASRDEALQAYADAVQCITRARAHKVFGQPGAPDGGASTAFRTVAEQIQSAKACDAAGPSAP